MVIYNLLLFIVILTIIIGLHELGHFVFAKKANILCFEFSIGMGPAIYQKRKGETNYAVRAIPLGGYVSMAGELQQASFFSKGKTVGLRLKDNQAYEIISTEELSYDIKGKIVDFDLYGKNMQPLFIELEVEGENRKFEVLRDAMIYLTNKNKMQVAPEERSFESKTLLQRFLVIFAGPAMNFILAFILFLIVGFMIGKPLNDNVVYSISESLPISTIDLNPGDKITEVNGVEINTWNDLKSVINETNSLTLKIKHSGTGDILHSVPTALVIQTIGLTNYNENGLVDLNQAIIGTAAGKSSDLLMAGDIITRLSAVDNPNIEINNWDDIYLFFKNSNETIIEVTYLRDNKVNTVTVETLSKNAVEKLGYNAIAIQLGISGGEKFNLGYSLAYPFKKIASDVNSTIQTVGLLINPKENVGIGDLSGPVGIFSLVSQASKGGFASILVFMGFLSVNIGIINLLPIPALDGGRIIFLGYELVTKKKIKPNVENAINNTMFILLLLLFVFVTYKDILRLF